MADEDHGAALRREKRRQKILQKSEERMKKITGHSSSEDVINNKPPVEDNATEQLGQSDLRKRHDVDRDSLNSQNSSADLDTVTDRSPRKVFDDGRQEHSDLFKDGSTPNNIGPKETSGAGKIDNDKSTSQFNKFRTVIMLLTGILVRWSFQYSFGQEYVQTIVNPFVALEVAVIGYQMAVGMDLGENVKGGIWLSTLVLAGIKAEIIYTYKNVMGAFTAATTDFLVFFFGFISLHLLL